MGWAKEQAIRQMEQGWSPIGNKQVCANCFEDYAIKQFIEQNVAANRCSYCRRRGRKQIAAEIDDVIEFIAAGISTEYEDPVHSVGWDSAEGGWLLPTMDARDLLSEAGLEETQEDLLEDLRQAFSQSEWVQKDPYGDLLCDALRYNWHAFAEQVKHRTRFVFFRIETAEKMSWETEPHHILTSLEEITKELELVRIVPRETSFFRGRCHEAAEELGDAKALGAPPQELASHSRTSPAGIAMLHVAADANTAQAETVFVNPAHGHMTVAEFHNLRELRILDLSIIPEVPSLFDEQKRHQRMPLIFLRHFANEISKPISDNVKAYEYVPTQVMTEYFRHLFRSGMNQSLDGLAFASSKRAGGVCYTLFFDQAACANEASEDGAVMLFKRATRHSRPK